MLQYKPDRMRKVLRQASAGLTSELGHEIHIGSGVVLQLIGLDHNVARIAKGSVHAGRRQGYAGIRQREALALLPRPQDHGRIAKGISDCEGMDLWPDVVEGVQDSIGLCLKTDCPPKGVLRANGVDVDIDRLVWG